MTFRRFLIAFAVMFAVPVGAESPTETAFDRGWEIIRQSHEALGGERAYAASMELILEAEGTLDRGARNQGRRPDSSDPGRYLEWLVIDDANDRVGFQQLHERYDGAIEHWRFVYTGEDLMRISDPVDRFAVQTREPSAGTKRRRIARIVPQILVNEAVHHPSSLRWLGLGEVDDERVDFVSWSIDGSAITMIVDHDTGYLHGVETIVDETLIGDAPVRWIYDDYELIDGFGPFPRSYRIELGGKVLKDVSFTRIETAGAADHPVFSVPKGLRVSRGTGGPSGVRTPRVVERAPWFWQVVGIRSGFNVAFFELEDYVVVFEAPAGWLELHEIPPSNFVVDATSSSTSRELIDLVHRTVPDKPIRFVVLSHFHGDHAGGVRAFVEEGSTIVTTVGAVDIIERAARSRFRIGHDQQFDAKATPRFRVVDGSLTLSDGNREMIVLEVTPNPHVGEMLVIWLPKEKSLFVADLFNATPLDSYPLASELVLQKAFVRWLDDEGLEPERIYGVHGGAGTAAHLEKVRRSR